MPKTDGHCSEHISSHNWILILVFIPLESSRSQLQNDVVICLIWISDEGDMPPTSLWRKIPSCS